MRSSASRATERAVVPAGSVSRRSRQDAASAHSCCMLSRACVGAWAGPCLPSVSPFAAATRPVKVCTRAMKSSSACGVGSAWSRTSRAASYRRASSALTWCTSSRAGCGGGSARSRTLLFRAVVAAIVSTAIVSTSSDRPWVRQREEWRSTADGAAGWTSTTRARSGSVGRDLRCALIGTAWHGHVLATCRPGQWGHCRCTAKALVGSSCVATSGRPLFGWRFLVIAGCVRQRGLVRFRDGARRGRISWARAAAQLPHGPPSGCHAGVRRFKQSGILASRGRPGNDKNLQFFFLKVARIFQKVSVRPLQCRQVRPHEGRPGGVGDAIISAHPAVFAPHRFCQPATSGGVSG